MLHTRDVGGIDSDNLPWRHDAPFDIATGNMDQFVFATPTLDGCNDKVLFSASNAQLHEVDRETRQRRIVWLPSPINEGNKPVVILDNGTMLYLTRDDFSDIPGSYCPPRNYQGSATELNIYHRAQGRIVFRLGDLSPDGGGTLLTFTDVAQDSCGEFAVLGDELGILSGIRQVVWQWREGQAERLITLGDESGSECDQFEVIDLIGVDHESRVVCLASPTGDPATTGLLVLDGVECLVVLVEGDTVPDLDGAVVTRLESYDMNRRGDTALLISVQDPSNAHTYRAISVMTAGGTETSIVVHEGAVVDVSDAQDRSDIRRVESLRMSDQCFNDAGEIAYALTFADGSEGVFVTKFIDRCFADLTASGVCELGSEDGAVDLSDFSCYLSQWVAQSETGDFTTTGECLPELGGDGVDLSDFTCYLAEWAQGCP